MKTCNLVVNYRITPDRTRAWVCPLTEVDVCIAANRIAAAVLSETPPYAWSAYVDGEDVTAKLAHVVRGVVGGGEGPEARFFLDTLWGEP